MFPAARTAVVAWLFVAASIPAVALPVPPPDPGETLEAALDREIARAEQALARIEEHAEQIEARRRQLSQSATEARAATAAFDARVQTIAGGGQDADRLYDEIVTELRQRRAELTQALDDWSHEDAVPGFSPWLDPERLDLTAPAGRVAELRALYARIAELEGAARVASRDQRWQAVVGLGDTVTDLDDVRVGAMKKISPERRRQLLGLTQEHLEQLRREVGHLVLELRLWRESRKVTFGNPVRLFGTLLDVGSTGRILMRVLAVLAVYLLIRGRVRPWLEAAGRTVDRLRGEAGASRRVGGLMRGLTAIGPWGVFLIFVVALRRAFESAASWPEVDLPLRLAMLYGFYRLVIVASHQAMLGVARRYRLRVTEERTRRLRSTVQTLTRFAFAAALLLTVTATLVGRGALYVLTLRLAGVAAVLVLLSLVAQWKSAIADAYLKKGGQGALARTVAATRDRLSGTFVMTLALFALAGRAAVVVARDFVLGFDEARRALAFLSRRKLEKQAEIQGYAEGDVDQLPAGIVEAFTEGAVTGGLRVDHFPGLDRFSEAVERWRDRGTGGTFMLTGEFGSGKSSWIQRAVESAPERWTTLLFEERIRSPKRLAAVLAQALGVDEVEGDLRALQSRLLDGEPRMIALDRCQNLFLGVVGGFRTFEAFVNLMETTCRNVFWLCAMDVHAWNYLVAVRADLNVFRLHHQLEPWTEERIDELIRIRSEACKLQVTYEDLFSDRLDRIDARHRSTETDRGYTRLLWNYSNGNPRIALHFWLRSLDAESETRARVRLFRAPDVSELENIGEAAQFLLAALVAHENLTVREAASVTRYSVPLCRIRFERLEDLGVLTPTEDGPERVDTHWQRAVLQFLKRRNLMVD